MMESFDFAELQRVNHQAHITIPGEPLSMVLIIGFIAATHAVSEHSAVAANIKNGRGGFFILFGQIKVCRHIELRQGLEIELLDCELLPLYFASDNRL